MASNYWSYWKVNLGYELFEEGSRRRQLQELIDGVEPQRFMILKWWRIEQAAEQENNFSFVVEDVSLKFLFSKNITRY
jgi:hypothetical protein